MSSPGLILTANTGAVTTESINYSYKPVLTHTRLSTETQCWQADSQYLAGREFLSGPWSICHQLKLGFQRWPMVTYPASDARHIFISGPGTIAKDRPDMFGIRPKLGQWSIPTWVYVYIKSKFLSFL